MKVVYHAPTLHTVYAQRTIYEGYKYAFAALGHEFLTYTAGMDLAEFLHRHHPDLFLTQSHFFHRKQLDYAVLARHRRAGMTLVTKVDFWNPVAQGVRRRDAVSLRDDPAVRRLLDADLLGDAFTHVVEQDDERMAGFREAIGRPWHTVPLAADERLLQAEPDPAMANPVVFLGTWLPGKRDAFAERLYPLHARGLTILGQDWTRAARLRGKAQRVGQYFDVPGLRALQRPAMTPDHEGVLYASADVCVNLHERHQVCFGGDCNERAFKIPAAGGFQVSDDVACLHSYFGPEEIVIAATIAEWFERIDHYLGRPEERTAIAAAGRRRVARDHTYRNRAEQLLTMIGAQHGRPVT